LKKKFGVNDEDTDFKYLEHAKAVKDLGSTEKGENTTEEESKKEMLLAIKLTMLAKKYLQAN
jgi:hypothetical protein